VFKNIDGAAFLNYVSKHISRSPPSTNTNRNPSYICTYVDTYVTNLHIARPFLVLTPWPYWYSNNLWRSVVYFRIFHRPSWRLATHTNAKNFASKMNIKPLLRRSPQTRIWLGLPVPKGVQSVRLVIAVHIQGDQMGFWKIAQKWTNPIFGQNKRITFTVEKIAHKYGLLYLVFFQKLPKDNNRPTGEN
jgi:hypothetical protein